MSIADGWTKIFATRSVLADIEARGYHDITADDIKAITGQEPRLMAKMDFREKIPPVMRTHGLAMLAIANGTYRIARCDPFIDICEKPESVAIEKVTFPNGLLTLDPASLADESAALDAALATGILEKVFGEKVQMTIRGRGRYTPFTLASGGVSFPVDGVQIEVDGGYEGAKGVYLVEAKVGARSNMALRQILYPHRAWEEVLAGRKQVRSYVCFYQEPLLRFIPVLCDDNGCRADHAGERAFMFESPATLVLDAIECEPAAVVPVSGTPFPQADDFKKVLAILSVAARQPQGISKDELFADFDIDDRQHDYYSNVLRWLGLVTIPRGGAVMMTAEGRRIAALPHAARLQALAEIIFREPVFHTVLHKGRAAVSSDQFMRWKCAGDTVNRRLTTVEAWVAYFRAQEKAKTAA